MLDSVFETGGRAINGVIDTFSGRRRAEFIGWLIARNQEHEANVIHQLDDMNHRLEVARKAKLLSIVEDEDHIFADDDYRRRSYVV